MPQDQLQELTLTVHYRTDVGQVRDHNEDYLGYQEPKEPERRAVAGRLYAVADGVGGHQAGEVASRVAVQTLLAAYYGLEEGRPADRLRQAVGEANRAVYDRAGQHVGRSRMSTTLVAAVIRGRELVVANVGDSRAYLVREGRIRQITRDHSAIAQMVSEGVLTPEEAKNHPQRRVLSRSIGTYADVEVDVFSESFLPGDRLLLCSDGLTEYLTEAELQRAMRSDDPEAVVQRLVGVANQRGGQDNITVLIVRALPESPARAPVPEPLPRATEAPATRRRRWSLVGVATMVLVACAAGLAAGIFLWPKIAPILGLIPTQPATPVATVELQGKPTSTATVEEPTNTPAVEQPTKTAPVEEVRPDLHLTVTSIHSVPLLPGGVITYTTLVVNRGDADATGVSIQAPLPDSTNFVIGSIRLDPSAPDSLGSAPPMLAGGLAVPAGGQVSATWVVTLDPSLAGGTTIVNTASVIHDGMLSPEGGSVTNYVAYSAELGVSKSADIAGLTEESEVLYTIVVTNSGPDEARGVVVSDSLPVSVTYVSYSATQGAYSTESGLWDVGALSNGGLATLSVTVRISGTVHTAITNTATVVVPGGVFDSKEDNNRDSVSIMVPPAGARIYVVDARHDPGLSSPGHVRYDGSDHTGVAARVHQAARRHISLWE